MHFVDSRRFPSLVEIFDRQRVVGEPVSNPIRHCPLGYESVHTFGFFRNTPNDTVRSTACVHHRLWIEDDVQVPIMDYTLHLVINQLSPILPSPLVFRERL